MGVTEKFREETTTAGALDLVIEVKEDHAEETIIEITVGIDTPGAVGNTGITVTVPALCPGGKNARKIAQKTIREVTRIISNKSFARRTKCSSDGTPYAEIATQQTGDNSVCFDLPLVAGRISLHLKQKGQTRFRRAVLSFGPR